jgi:hypothetical protein
MANLNRDRGIRAEREISIRLQRAAGRIADPRLEPMTTVTGRVGQLTSLGFDILVGNGETAIVGEAKRRKSFLAADALRALLQIARISFEWARTPVLAFRLADDIPAFIDTKLGKRRLERDYLVLPMSFAEKAIMAMRYLEETGLTGDFVDWQDNQNTASVAEEVED